jgi:hypothetical protein
MDTDTTQTMITNHQAQVDPVPAAVKAAAHPCLTSQ